jgi:hypothetical protein
MDLEKGITILEGSKGAVYYGDMESAGIQIKKEDVQKFEIGYEYLQELFAEINCTRAVFLNAKRSTCFTYTEETKTAKPGTEEPIIEIYTYSVPKHQLFYSGENKVTSKGILKQPGISAVLESRINPEMIVPSEIQEKISPLDKKYRAIKPNAYFMEMYNFLKERGLIN